ncbi:hypothetical protein AUEXF2481DRAFT_30041 [Aureobasidium subglaciale EXF-2481]|uniref:Trafficking protein particle complex subunit n=1 Tax=Aureobasidium subglaciale (strain EXF-2481) TaxID=1043005 RepID=A0A074YKR2_AURSE|nr:uncharacterized protein AUEXF2481DRAFT_30041 [Aureobasidium subglaciale EXF-2481]KAI5212315.1 Sybindin-like protein [Aureobasidium subglaciale]KAI5231750.1 Sybindin-like protein [Aureobasidium subglaciale]KAI5234460.1 Sybindin-like protein [Aureobasidium subglaciale]KAI5267854.1 Sybindin-like protein [Aureobasidium subglaciale]KEQ94667.1 hypothetical protein AUEXF2481DRAFT_30041 [Aureobasidium subglaciale EXF-2481]
MQGGLTASLADFSTHGDTAVSPRSLSNSQTQRQQDSLSSTAELERNHHAGGLIYNRNFAPGLQQLSSNDYLILAGTFHGIHAISRSLSPVAPSHAPPGNRANHATGIQSLESSHFRLTCFQTPTGTKFLVFTSPEQPNTDQIARRCYDIYADYVMANPFYSLEMPIRVDKFDRALAAYLVRP